MYEKKECKQKVLCKNVGAVVYRLVAFSLFRRVYQQM